MPKYAVMTFMFKPWWIDGRVTHEAMLEGFAGEGADGVEPFHRDFVEDPELLPRYRKACDDNGIKVAAVDVMCNLVYSNATQKQEDRDEMRRGLDVCVGLGAEIAHVAGHRLRDGVSASDGRKMIAEGLLEVADFAEQNGLTLAIEDFDPAPDLLCTLADCIEVMTLAEDRVKFVFDTGNFEAVGERADANVAAVADRICHCHFKDFAPAPDTPTGRRGCHLGAGMVPNAEVARLLMERDYDGWVALETIGRSDVSPVDAVAGELPILKSWFAA